MARTNTLGNFLTDVANAIREKKGTSETIQASDFDTEIANLPSGTAEPKTLNDVNNIIHNYGLYLTSLLNNYEAYTNEAITIYTPNSLCTNFMIQKRTGNKYRIVWANDMGRFLLLSSNTSQTFTYNYVNSPTAFFDNMSLFLNNSTYTSVNAYYSNEFSSLEELINNLKSSTGNITYTSWTGSGFTGILDNDWKTPITNVTMFENDSNTPVINGKVLSHNLTILTRE